MKRKTVSLDADIYRHIKTLQRDHESISATLRRSLEIEKDPADYLDDLFRDFGGKGMMSEADLNYLEDRQRHPRRSPRPADFRRKLHAP